jgi:hypothetical protein
MPGGHITERSSALVGPPQGMLSTYLTRLCTRSHLCHTVLPRGLATGAAGGHVQESTPDAVNQVVQGRLPCLRILTWWLRASGSPVSPQTTRAPAR